MISLQVTQGSPEWLSLRSRCLTASEAPAMMGTSPYMTRADLLKQKATGIVREVDAATQARFDKGHQIEAAARAFIEAEIGDELYPVTATDDDGWLLASFDGVSMDGSLIWECKTANRDLAVALDMGDLPASHWPQVEQQLLISGAGVCIFTLSDGTRAGTQSLDYASRPERRAALLAGWKQFEADLADWKPEPEIIPAQAAPIADLPALIVQIRGEIVTSNLPQWQAVVSDRIAAISTDLQTDEDFATAEKTVKFLDDGEKKLDLVKTQAQAQAADIDTLFRAVDQIKAEMRAKRLNLDKLVKARKESIRTEIVHAAQQALAQHEAALNTRLGVPWLPRMQGNFADAIKGRKTVASLRDACDTELARCKIAASEVADRIEINRRAIVEAGHPHLFPDAQSLCQKAPDDLAAVIKSRILEAEAKERARLDAERARLEAEARAAALAQAPPEPAPTMHISPAAPLPADAASAAAPLRIVPDAEGIDPRLEAARERVYGAILALTLGELGDVWIYLGKFRRAA